MRLPSGHAYVLGRDCSEEPDAQQLLSLDACGDLAGLALFTREDLAQQYCDARAEEGWEVNRIAPATLLDMLAEFWPRGGTHVVVDPEPGGPGEAVPVVRVLLDLA